MGHFTNLFITCLASFLVFVYLLNIKAGIHLKKKNLMQMLIIHHNWVFNKHV